MILEPGLEVEGVSRAATPVEAVDYVLASVAGGRPRSARRPAVALRELRAFVRQHLDAGTLESPARLDVSRERECDPRPEREDVRAHRDELVLRHLDDLDAARLEELDDAYREQRQVRDHEIVGERRDERHQVEDFAAAEQVRQIKDVHVRVGERFADRRDAGVVRAVTASDEQRLVVEPEQSPPSAVAGASRRATTGIPARARTGASAADSGIRGPLQIRRRIAP